MAPTGRRWAVLASLLLAIGLLPAAATADTAAPGDVHGSEAEVLRGERLPESGGLIVTRADGSHLPVDVADLAELRAVLDRVERSADLVSVRPDPVFRPLSDDPLLDLQWSREPLGIAAAHEIATGSGIVVAVIDGGVDAGHEDLRGQVLEGYDIIEDRPGGDHDPHGHGTLVSGMIAAVADNGLGIAGAAPDVRILPVRVIAADGDGMGSNITAGIEWATANGADVINLSIGSPDDTPGLEDAIDDAVEQGVVVVAAAGNAGDGENPVMYPAGYPATFAVGAVDEANRIASFSSFGDHLDIVAPGVDVISTRVTDGASDYRFWSGTSASAPLVAATSAMALQAAGDASRTGAHVEAVLDSMTSTALDLGEPGWDPRHGHGLVRADLAVREAAELGDADHDQDDGSDGDGDEADDPDPIGEDPDEESEPDPADPGPEDDGEPSEGDDQAAVACPDSVPAAGFLDTPGTTFEADIDCIVWWDVAKGVTVSEFAPVRDVTRAQVATFLHRMLDRADLLPRGGSRHAFGDVGTDHTHREAIETLAGLGVIRGVSPERFEPSRPVTRGQMASLVVRLHEQVLDQPTPAGSATLTDIGGTTHEDNIHALVALGVANGYADGTYRPLRPVARGQMAAFLARYLDHLTGAGIASPPLG